MFLPRFLHQKFKGFALAAHSDLKWSWNTKWVWIAGHFPSLCLLTDVRNDWGGWGWGCSCFFLHTGSLYFLAFNDMATGRDRVSLQSTQCGLALHRWLGECALGFSLARCTYISLMDHNSRSSLLQLNTWGKVKTIGRSFRFFKWKLTTWLRFTRTKLQLSNNRF